MKSIKKTATFGKKESCCSTTMQQFIIHYRDGLLLPHASYLPDFAPSDYFLFPNIKKMVCW